LHDHIGFKYLHLCLRRNLTTTLSASQILADAIIPLFPLWLVRKAIYLPTKTFKLFRTNKCLANREGRRAVREKMEIARQGLEPSNDVFSLLRKGIPVVEYIE
jgi:hypothetical protein